MRVLKNKNIMKASKTGGLRRKQTARKLKSVAKVNEAQTKLKNIIIKLNRCIDEVHSVETYNKQCINYINQSLTLIYSELRKHEINPKSKIIKSTSILRRDWSKIYEHIIQTVQNSGTTCRFKNNYSFYKKNLSDYGYTYMIACYTGLYDDLLSKVYINDGRDFVKPEDSELEKCLERLDLGTLTDFIETAKTGNKQELYAKFMAKTLECHIDALCAMKEPDKYKIVRARIKKAFITLDMYLDILF